jgi:hypothetical protein
MLPVSGAASDKQQWKWNCYVHGRPSSADDSGPATISTTSKGQIPDGMGAYPRRAHR